MVSAFQCAVLVKVSAALVLYIPACCTSTYSVFYRFALPRVLSLCQMLPADITYFGACSYTVSLRPTVFCYNHQVPSTIQCVCVVPCSKCLCVLTMCFKVKSIGTLCFTRFVLICVEKMSAIEAIGVKKGGFMWYFRLPSTS